MQKKTTFILFLMILLASCASPASEPVVTAIPTQTQAPVPTATATPQPEPTFVDEKAEISAIYDENGDPKYVLQDDAWVAAELNAYGLLQAKASDNRIVIWNFERQEWESAINWSDMDLAEIAGPQNFRYGEGGELEIRDRGNEWETVVGVNEDGTLRIYHDRSEDFYVVERGALGIAEVNGLGTRIIATVNVWGDDPLEQVILIPEYSAFVSPIDFEDPSVMNMDMGYLHFAVDVGIVERSGLLQVPKELREMAGRELYLVSGSGARIHFSPIYSGRTTDVQSIPKVSIGGPDDPFLPLGLGNWNWEHDGNVDTGSFNVFAYNWEGKIVILTRFGDSFERNVGVMVHLWEDPSEFDPKQDGKTVPEYFAWTGGQQITMNYNDYINSDWFLIPGFPKPDLLQAFWDEDLDIVKIDAGDSANVRAMRELQRRINMPVWSR